MKYTRHHCQPCPELAKDLSWEHLVQSLFQPFVRIANHQLHIFHASFDQRTQKRQPKCFFFARPKVKTQQMPFTPLVNTNTHNKCHADYALVLADLEIRGVQSNIWITRFQRTIAKFIHYLAQFFIDPGHFAFINAGQSKSFQQGIDPSFRSGQALSGAYSFQVGFLNHCQKRFFRWPAGFQQAGKEAALRSLGIA